MPGVFWRSLTPPRLEGVETHKARVLRTCPCPPAADGGCAQVATVKATAPSVWPFPPRPQVPVGVFKAIAEAHEPARGLAVSELGVHLAEAFLGGAGETGVVQLRDDNAADARDVCRQSGFAASEQGENKVRGFWHEGSAFLFVAEGSPELPAHSSVL